MKLTVKAGQFRELLDTYSFPAGSNRLFPTLPLRFAADGIHILVASNEKTAALKAHFAPDPYTVTDPTDEVTYISVPDLLPILGRFSQDDIINIVLDKTFTITGAGKQFIHYPASDLTANIPPSIPTFDEKNVMTTKAGPAVSFLSFDTSTFQDVLEDAKVLSADTYPIELAPESYVNLGASESKKDSATIKLKGTFDGVPTSFILGAEFAYLMRNVKGDMTLQTLPGFIVCFTKKTSKPSGTINVFIAPKVTA